MAVGKTGLVDISSIYCRHNERWYVRPRMRFMWRTLTAAWGRLSDREKQLVPWLGGAGLRQDTFCHVLPGDVCRSPALTAISVPTDKVRRGALGERPYPFFLECAEARGFDERDLDQQRQRDQRCRRFNNIIVAVGNREAPLYNLVADHQIDPKHTTPPDVQAKRDRWRAKLRGEQCLIFELVENDKMELDNDKTIRHASPQSCQAVCPSPMPAPPPIETLTKAKNCGTGFISKSQYFTALSNTTPYILLWTVLPIRLI